MIDVAVVGAGPAGLSAAVNGAAEGLDVIVISPDLGGRMGSSSLIENVLGFPVGVSGETFTHRSVAQAEHLGAAFMKGKVTYIRSNGKTHELTLESGSRLHAKTVVITCGADYLIPEWVPERTPHGVHYAATPSMLRSFHSKKVALIIGGANSAGQAANFLAKHFEKVIIAVRSGTIEAGMSYYLCQRIKSAPNIQVRQMEVAQLLVDERFRLKKVKTTADEVLDVDELFVMIGAKPNCYFAKVKTDEKGFIITDNEYRCDIPGIFAAGDIRSNNIKRAASAIGEGAACIQSVYRYIKELDK